MDRRRLRADARRAAPPRRGARRPVRPPRRARSRLRASSAAAAALGAIAQDRRRTLIVLRAAHGHRRRAGDARHAVDHHQHVPARGAGQGGRHLGRLRRHRRHARPAHRRARCSKSSRGARSSSPPRSLAFVPRRRGRARRAVARRRPSTSGSTRRRGAVRRSASASLVFGIIEGPEQGWTSADHARRARRRRRADRARSSLAELRSKAPLLDPRFFRHRGFATGSASLFLQFFAMFGFFFVALQFLQLVLGYIDAHGRGRAAAR